MEYKGYRVTFVDGKVLVWKKDSDVDSAKVICIREGGMHKILGRLAKALVHENTKLCELLHRILVHIHYKAFPTLKNMVTILLELQVDHEGVCKGCALHKNVKGYFHLVTICLRGSWI